jgi:hypothetical protein
MSRVYKVTVESKAKAGDNYDLQKELEGEEI